MLSYNLVHKDGRTSSPLVLINWIPACEISLLTLHATALLDFQNAVRPSRCTVWRLQLIADSDVSQVDISKVLEVRDGVDGLTKSALEAKLLA